MVDLIIIKCVLVQFGPFITVQIGPSLSHSCNPYFKCTGRFLNEMDIIFTRKKLKIDPLNPQRTILNVWVGFLLRKVFRMYNLSRKKLKNYQCCLNQTKVCYWIFLKSTFLRFEHFLLHRAVLCKGFWNAELAEVKKRTHFWISWGI